MTDEERIQAALDSEKLYEDAKASLAEKVRGVQPTPRERLVRKP